MISDALLRLNLVNKQIAAPQDVMLCLMVESLQTFRRNKLSLSSSQVRGNSHILKMNTLYSSIRMNIETRLSLQA
jgi:hypothetical protein